MRGNGGQGTVENYFAGQVLLRAVIVRTYGEQIFRRICFSDTPLLWPVTRSVSA